MFQSVRTEIMENEMIFNLHVIFMICLHAKTVVTLIRNHKITVHESAYFHTLYFLRWNKMYFCVLDNLGKIMFRYSHLAKRDRSHEIEQR